MANTTDEKKDTKSTNGKSSGSSATPIIIIGLIFVVTILGIWYISSGGKSTEETETANANSGNSTAANQPTSAYTNAPQGATPEHFKGSASAPVLVEEFADYQCPACGATHPLMNEIVSEFGDQIKFVFRNYPLVRNHPNAYSAAVAVEAAGFQDKFWEMQNQVFSGQTEWSNDPNPRAKFEEYAKKLGLDVQKFSSDSLGIAAKNRVDQDMTRGNAIGFNSTPTLFINGVIVPSSQMTQEGLRALIGAQLKKAGQSAGSVGSTNGTTSNGSNAAATESNNKGK